MSGPRRLLEMLPDLTPPGRAVPAELSGGLVGGPAGGASVGVFLPGRSASAVASPLPAAGSDRHGESANLVSGNSVSAAAVSAAQVLAGRLADAERTIAALRQQVRRLEDGRTLDPESEVFNLHGFLRQFHRELAAAQRTPYMNGVLVLIQVLSAVVPPGFEGAAAPAPAGLAAVAGFLSGHVRPYDVVGQVCSATFAVLLTRTCNLGGRHRGRLLVRALQQQITVAGAGEPGADRVLAGLRVRAAIIGYNKTYTVDRAFGEARKALSDAWAAGSAEEEQEYAAALDDRIVDQLPSEEEIRFLLDSINHSSP